MKITNEDQQKELDELYEKYYNYLCKWHSLDKMNRPWYHKNDFIEAIEDEAMSIKVGQGY